jgi:acetylornithine deacetylase/succinyl-diaminopimelate desuccinylase-like protein
MTDVRAGAEIGEAQELAPALGKVVDVCRRLLQFDTSNPGRDERPAAEYVADLLTSAGLTVHVVEAEPGRTNVVVRIAGRDPSLPALLIHGHLDVVPANPGEWSEDPFGGDIKGGCLWGRGAVDMKDMVAMMVVVASEYGRLGRQPMRDLVFAFVADEEAGGELGSGYLVRQHRDLFAGCTEAIGEVGGFSVPVAGGRRLYFIETAEKGLAWIRLTVRGAGGHASMTHPDNPVVRLAGVLARLASRPLPLHLTEGVIEFIETVSRLLGITVDLTDPGEVEDFMGRLGHVGRMLQPTLRNTLTPTVIEAGYKENVVPAAASAVLDCRFLPGFEGVLEQELEDLIGGEATWEYLRRMPSVESPSRTPMLAMIEAALVHEDPLAVAVPYTLAAGSDAKWFSELGIRCYGFTPLLLPADFDFSAMFHAVDERVPIESLLFGVRVLQRFLDS